MRKIERELRREFPQAKIKVKNNGHYRIRLANGNNSPAAASRPRASLRVAISASSASSYSSWALVSDHQMRSSVRTDSVLSQWPPLLGRASPSGVA